MNRKWWATTCTYVRSLDVSHNKDPTSAEPGSTSDGDRTKNVQPGQVPEVSQNQPATPPEVVRNMLPRTCFLMIFALFRLWKVAVFRGKPLASARLL